MPFEGEVRSIHVTGQSGAPMTSVSEARLVPGRGIEGDRYADGGGKFSDRAGPGREVTLIESEAVEALALGGIVIAPGDARRNIVTRGVPLNHLVGREFSVGEVVLRGVRLAEPCSHLASLTQSGVSRGLVHRGGLRADILRGGTIRSGDRVWA